jgi:hypothetical protein
MPRITFRRNRAGKTQLLLAVACVALLVATTLAAKTWLVAPVAAESAAAITQTTTPSVAATPVIPVRLESEHVTIRPTGFEPTEIARPAGRILLAVNDRSGLDSLDLRLDIETVHRLFEVRVPRDTNGRHEWRQVVTLVPGHYVLTEANHPDWVCRITVTPN